MVGIWRGLLAVTFAYVLLLQLVASGVAGTTHVAARLTIGEIDASVICGPGGAEADPSMPAHIEGTNTCCVWGMSGAAGAVGPPPSQDQGIRYASSVIAMAYGERPNAALKAKPSKAHASRAPPVLD